jgi:(p)ppGpp synthase/HD superfamily hydrolase
VLEQLTPLLQHRGDMKQEILPGHDESGSHHHHVTGKNGHSSHEEGASESLQVLPGESANSQDKPDSNPPIYREGVTDSHFEVVVKLAHCCCPIPGDAIVGFLNPNKGIIVHRTDCRTLRRRREYARERFVEVNWLQIEPQRYLAPISIIAHDRAGLLRDVAAVVADAGINMTAVASTTNASLQKAVITATLEIEAIDQIEPIFKRLLQIKNVVSVARDLGRRLG